MKTGNDELEAIPDAPKLGAGARATRRAGSGEEGRSSTPEEIARAILALPGAFSAAQLVAAYRAAACHWHAHAVNAAPETYRAITVARDILKPLAQA